MFELPDNLGPKMRALRDDRQRRFALIMAYGTAKPTEAAREAGYSDHLDAAKVQAHHLMHNDKIQEAIEEASFIVLRTLGPKAIQAARAILEKPDHKAHARIIEAVLDRVGFGAKTEHKITVEHIVDLKELETLARRLAVENGIDPERFVGAGGLGDPIKVIEHQDVTTEVSRETLAIGGVNGLSHSEATRDSSDQSEQVPR